MSSRKMIIDEQVVEIPELCAWCGKRTGTEMRVVLLVNRHLWMRLRYTLPLSICPLCREYLETLRRAERRLELILIAITTPLAVILVDRWLNAIGRQDDWLTFALGAMVLSVGLAWILHEVLVRGDLRARLLQRLDGEALSGYASDSDMPGEVTDAMGLRFYSL
ncbi:MAG: hypothetical protein ACP5HG_02270, partial [Anaerolineae bacterium]